MSVSFARMASDVVLAGWDPEFEYVLMVLQEQIAELQDNEAELEAMDTALCRDLGPLALTDPLNALDHASQKPSVVHDVPIDLNAPRPPSASSQSPPIASPDAEAAQAEAPLADLASNPPSSSNASPGPRVLFPSPATATSEHQTPSDTASTPHRQGSSHRPSGGHEHHRPLHAHGSTAKPPPPSCEPSSLGDPPNLPHSQPPTSQPLPSSPSQPLASSSSQPLPSRQPPSFEEEAGGEVVRAAPRGADGAAAADVNTAPIADPDPTKPPMQMRDAKALFKALGAQAAAELPHMNPHEAFRCIIQSAPPRAEEGAEGEQAHAAEPHASEWSSSESESDDDDDQ